MKLTYYKIISPNEWQHSPELKNIFGETVAMTLTYRGVIPPKEWYHDPKL